jgi:hypothetical protein
MKSISRFAAAIVILFVVAIADVPYLSRMLVPDAQALRGRGAAFAVGAAAGKSSASSAADATSQQQAATAQQQAATAQQQSATAQQQSATAQQQTAAAQQTTAAPAKPLPLGTVVATLPAGCTPTAIGGVNYYSCGGNYYKAAYEGSTLKYVTTQPK